MRAFADVSESSWLQGRRLLPLMRRHGERARGVVVDFGCGRSPLRPLFSAAQSYVRMDREPIDPEVIVIKDPLSLPLDSGSVEIVILSRVLGDLPDVVGVLRELNRVLEPGGRILIYESMNYPQHDLPHDYWRVLPAGLRWAAGEAGLAERELEFLGGYFTQLAMHWNLFIVGNLGGYAITRPLARLARLCGNLVCAGLDKMMPRPILATDYFACIVKVSVSTKVAL